MAHNNIQPTFEKIHSGLSGLSNDEKWQDVLNFRFANNHTVAIPHKLNLKPGDKSGLHTIIAGLDGHNFAIGACASFGFVSANNFCTYPLWRLKQTYTGSLGSRDEQSQRLLVQGSYTGDQPIKLRVALVKGKLTPFWAVNPVADEDNTTTPPVVVPGSVDITYLVVDEATSEPILDARIIFIRGGIEQYNLFTSPSGRVTIKNFLPGIYTVIISKDTYSPFTEDISLSTTNTYLRGLSYVPMTHGRTDFTYAGFWRRLSALEGSYSFLTVSENSDDWVLVSAAASAGANLTGVLRLTTAKTGNITLSVIYDRDSATENLRVSIKLNGVQQHLLVVNAPTAASTEQTVSYVIDMSDALPTNNSIVIECTQDSFSLTEIHTRIRIDSIAALP